MAASKFELKERPTNHDLQKQSKELHDCLHQVGHKVAVNQVQTAMLARAMGIELPTEEELLAGAQPRQVKRRLGGIPPWQALFGGITALGSVQVLYKILEPTIIAAAIALHRALMGTH